MSKSTSLACLVLLACGGQRASDTFEVETADDSEGLRAVTTVDGERLTIEARIMPGAQARAAAEGEAKPEDVLVARVSGQSETYADWRIGMVSDQLSGTLGGWTFGEADAARDWAALAESPVSRVLGEVSRRAGAALASGDYPAVELELFTVADMGPYLQALPGIMNGIDAVCGDGECSVDETDANCPEDCGCAAEAACGGVAPFGCTCADDCADKGDCCVDACQTCGAGCPPCGDAIPCDGACIDVSNVCNGQVECLTEEDEARCASGACRAGQFACDGGACLEFYQWCDGEMDCPGGEDERCECAYCDPG